MFHGFNCSPLDVISEAASLPTKESSDVRYVYTYKGVKSSTLGLMILRKYHQGL